MFKFLLLFAIPFYSTMASCQEMFVKKDIDSIIVLREFARNSKLKLVERIAHAKAAISLSEKTGADSTILKSKKVLSYLYILNNDFSALTKTNLENLELAERIDDTLAIANAFHNLGYSASERLKNSEAYEYYFQAVKFYKILNKKQSIGVVLHDMAAIQESEKDYIGSEINAIEAIKNLENSSSTDYNLGVLWSLHNMVGLVSIELGLFNKAIEYHEKASQIAKKIGGGHNYQVYSKSNIASVYIKKKNYSEAISRFEKILLENKSIIKDSSSYASILTSLSYSKFLNKQKTPEINSLFKKALNIYGLKNDKLGEMYTSNYYAEYLKGNNQVDSALKYTNKAYDIAKSINSNENVLKSLMLKSSLVKDSSDIYFQEHIALNDSLQKKERTIRNKFARIEYETEEVKQKNEQISRQRLWLLLITGILAVTLFLLYIIKTQREKNKELELAQKQQEFNEEIYNLMLSQQEKIDQGRSQEKKQISQELHDGVLGRLFGVRLSLDSLNYSKTDEAIETRGNYIEELQAIEQDIRKVSHELNVDFVANSGYFDIVKTLVEKQTKAYKLDYTLLENNDINWDALTNKTKMHCYRIIQESLQNIYKHARGTRVDISFEQVEGQLKLIIKDDGNGFDLTKAKKGIGLKNMYARVKEIKGNLDVKTSLNIGTTLIIQVPN